MSRVFFKAGKSADQVGIVSGVGAIVTWDRLLFQSNANINLPNERFTPENLTPIHFDVSVRATNLSVGAEPELRVLKNSSTVVGRKILTAIPETDAQLQVTCQDAPAPFDFYEVTFLGTSGGTITLTADPTMCWFFAQQI